MAVFEVLDDLRELIWRSYGGQIQQVLLKERIEITRPCRGTLPMGTTDARSGKGPLAVNQFADYLVERTKPFVESCDCRCTFKRRSQKG